MVAEEDDETSAGRVSQQSHLEDVHALQECRLPESHRLCQVAQRHCPPSEDRILNVERYRYEAQNGRARITLNFRFSQGTINY